MIELKLAELAQNFWDEAGGFGEDLETAIVMSLPIITVPISQLTLHKAVNWLDRRGIELAGLGQLPDRALRACLLAYGKPYNFILWDNADPPADQQFSLAHEVAHFLLDFEQPRQKAVKELGPQVLTVFDGVRPPTIEERILGVIAGVQVRPQHHFMERGKQGDILNEHILEIESRADQLALEIIAPQEQAMLLLGQALKGQMQYMQRLDTATTELIVQFKLAPNVAKPYAKQLLELVGAQQKFSEWLKS
jgi:hypothetical protein